MEKKEQVHYFIPAIPVRFFISIKQERGFVHSTRRTHMPAVPFEGNYLSLLINKKEYDLEVEKVIYVEDIPQGNFFCEIRLCNIILNDPEILEDLAYDPDWELRAIGGKKNEYLCD